MVRHPKGHDEVTEKIETWADDELVSFRIKLNGCDGANYFEMLMDSADLEVARQIAKKSMESSEYECQPTMVLAVRVKPGDITDDKNFTEVAL